MNNSDILEQGRAVFSTEITALQKTYDAIGEDFAEIVQLMLHCEGKVIITGIGKPGSTFCVAALNSLQNAIIFTPR